MGNYQDFAKNLTWYLWWTRPSSILRYSVAEINKQEIYKDGVPVAWYGAHEDEAVPFWGTNLDQYLPLLSGKLT